MTFIQQVWRYLEQYPGQNMFVSDIAKALSLTEGQVSGAVSGMRKAGEDVVRPAYGVIRYHPQKDKREILPPGNVSVSEVIAAGRIQAQGRDVFVGTIPNEGEAKQTVMTSATPTTLAVIGRTTDGALILKDSNEVLYRAVPM